MIGPLRVLAVDDEQLALRRLELLLARLSGVELVGTARSGREALDQMAELRPDVMLLDIKMADLDGFDVVEGLKGPFVPLVIFVTAFDHFAARAFEVSAIDYVVKPVDLERLRAALDRARRSLLALDAETRVAELQDILAALRAESAPRATKRYESEIWAERRGEYVRVLVADLDWIEAERDYVHLHVGGSSYLLRETIGGMEERLDPDAFIRVRRSALVRRGRIAAIRRRGYGDFRIQLSTGQEVRVGTTYLKQVRALIAPRPE